MFKKRNVGKSDKRTSAVSTVQEVNADPEGEKYILYRWSQSQTFIVQYFTAGMLCIITAIVAVYGYIFWRYELWPECMGDALFCVLAESFVVCWAFYWQKDVKPKLPTYKKSRGVGVIIFAFAALAVLYAAMTYRNVVEWGPDPLGNTQIVFILFGGRIGLEFLGTRIEYRHSQYYKRVSFYEFCNLPIEGDKK